tara:strand:- start:4267 stop:4860 length:594 start_codon:yes stop_codon:yes gene_type:complete
MSIISVDSVSPRQSGVAVTFTGSLDVDNDVQVSGVATVGVASITDVVVSGASTFMGASTFASGALTVSNTTESTTKDTGAVIIDGGIGIEKNLTLGTTVKIDAGTGVVTATTFAGNLTGTPTLGTGVTVYSSGIVSATTFEGNLTGNPVLGTGVTVYSAGIVSCTSIDADSALGGLKTTIDAKATTGKAIAMAMVFG